MIEKYLNDIQLHKGRGKASMKTSRALLNWKSYLVALLSVLLLLSGCGGDTTSSSGQTVEELELQITEVQEENEDLQSELDTSIVTITELEKELENQVTDVDLKNKITQLEEEKQTIEEEINKLEKDNNHLNEDNQVLKEEIKSKEAEYEVKLAEAQTSAGTESSNISNQTNTEEQSSCEIKGSVNGIYHVPGSTYYEQTKNVAQYFCSEEEAESAGYRAPKR